MIKRILIILVCLLMLTAVATGLCACGSGSGGSAQSASGSDTSDSSQVSNSSSDTIAQPYFRGDILFDESNFLQLVRITPVSDFWVYCTFDGTDLNLEYARLMAVIMLMNTLDQTDHKIMVVSGSAENIVILTYTDGELDLTSKFPEFYDTAVASQEQCNEEYAFIIAKLSTLIAEQSGGASGESPQTSGSVESE